MDIQKKSIEFRYTEQVSLEHRKKFAQFFTPQSIAKLMVRWLLGNDSLRTVLEPAFGLGVFSRVLLSMRSGVHISGFEIDDLIFGESKKEFSDVENLDLHLGDYMYNDWDNKYDGIVCNPPYFKFHDYDNKTILKEVENRLKCKLNGFTNLYTLFLIKSIHQLNPNGRCAYIIPSEFLNSDYGKLVKKHLLRTGTLRHVIVIDFGENIFDEVLTTASIILCANDKGVDKVGFTNIKSIDELDKLEGVINGYPKFPIDSRIYSFSELDSDTKWRVYYQPQNGSKFVDLVTFSTYAKVVRGIATGANDYFTFNLSKAEQYDIDESYLLPCICHAFDARGIFFTKSDFEELRERDKKVFVLNAINSDSESVVNYITKGEREGINKRYLTANRSPWYSLERRSPSPIWVSVFNRTGLRFIRNEANILNLTPFHCIYPRTELFSDVSVDVLFAYLLTDTARQIFEDNSREYGNGLQKFEPNDLNKGKMLDLRKLSKKSKNKIEMLCKNKPTNYNEIDHILLEDKISNIKT